MHGFTYMWNIKEKKLKVKLKETENRKVVAIACEVGEIEVGKRV